MSEKTTTNSPFALPTDDLRKARWTHLRGWTFATDIDGTVFIIAPGAHDRMFSLSAAELAALASPPSETTGAA